MGDYEQITAGYWLWQRAPEAAIEPVKVVEDSAGRHIRTFDGVFSEALYGKFHGKVTCQVGKANCDLDDLR